MFRSECSHHRANLHNGIWKKIEAQLKIASWKLHQSFNENLRHHVQLGLRGLELVELETNWTNQGFIHGDDVIDTSDMNE